MEAVIGTLLFAVAVTLFTWSFIQFRVPTRPAWTKGSFPAMLVALSVVTSLLLSGTFFTRAVIDLEKMPIGPVAIGSIVVIAVAMAFAMRQLLAQWRALNRSARLAGGDLPRTTSGSVFTPANDSGHLDASPRPGTGGGKPKPRRKAA